MEIDGILAEIVKDMATYDLRNWRKAGITPDEIRTRLEHPELCSDIFDKAISEDRFPNVSGSRIFGYLWKELQKIPCADKVIEAVMSHRTEELPIRFGMYGVYCNMKGKTVCHAVTTEPSVLQIPLFKLDARTLLYQVTSKCGHKKVD